MKFRKGFVTNSSSSCYICQICGNDCSGMDVCLSDCKMSECQNGHTFCNRHMLDVEITEQDMLDDLITASEEGYKSWVKWASETDDEETKERWNRCAQRELQRLDKLKVATSIDDFENDYDELVNNEGVSSKECPICQLIDILDSDMLEYVLAVYNLDKINIAESMRKFESLSELKKSFE